MDNTLMRGPLDQAAGITRMDPTPSDGHAHTGPTLDPDQRRVLAHAAGHLLVMGAPATGRTTTLVELVVSRIGDELRPVPAASVLVLGRGRRSADELASGLSRRLGTGLMPVVSTFHSFALAALRQAATDPSGGAVPPPAEPSQPIRLLNAAQQEARLRELLTFSVAEGRLRWPASLSGALGTRGIAEEARRLLARARSLGLDGRDLARLGRREGVDAWVAMGAFFDEYLDVLDHEGALDYSELIHRATALAAHPRAGRRLREAFRLIVVDQYEEVEPAQARLLQHLAVGGAQVMAFGDPDQSVHGFQAGTGGALVEFPDRFRGADGRPAGTVVLRNGHGMPAAIRRAAMSVLRPATLSPLPVAVQRMHREPIDRPGGRVRASVYPDPRAEGLGIAAILLRAHAGIGAGRALPWRQMAVVLRNPSAQSGPVARALRAGGIPLVEPGANRPLADEPLVAQLATVIELALAGLQEGRGPASDTPESAQVLDLLLDAAPDDPSVLPPGESRVMAIVAAARTALDGDETVASVLWAAWEASGLAVRLRETAIGGGPGASAADRALDAMVQLFQTAHAQPLRGPMGMMALLDQIRSMRIAVAAQDRSADAVQLLSAHLAKARSWELVVLAGVQEGIWPSVQVRGDVLHVAELGDGVRVPGQDVAAMVADERRLFYVASSTARRNLVVTAVGGEQARPSRFLMELGVEVEVAAAQAESVMSPVGLVATLRRTAQQSGIEPSDSPSGHPGALLRRAAIARLADLAGQRGALAVPGADPGSWWHARELSSQARPALAPRSSDHRQGPEGGAALAPAPHLSASAMSAVLACPLRWFLERSVGARVAAGPAAGVGVLVHAVAEAVAKGDLAADEVVIGEVVDDAWAAMTFEAKYQRATLRARVDAMIRTFLEWHRTSGRDPVAVEAAFSSRLELPDGPLELTGSVDRLDRDSEGRLHVVDFKTGRSAASADQAAGNPQLAVYQLCVRAADLPVVGPVPVAIDASSHPVVAGAELVHLGDTYVSGLPKVRVQAALGSEPGWAEALVAEAARLTRGPRFPARPSHACNTCAFRSMCPASRAGSASSGEPSGGPLGDGAQP